MTDSAPTPKHRSRRGRVVPLAWISGAAAALVLILGVTGTLSDWTTAIIGNSTNTIATRGAVILKEVGPDATGTSQTCTSTDGMQTVLNSFTCATINKYGGATAPITLNGSQTVSVTMSNTGSETGALTLVAGACTTVTGTGITGAPSACSQLLVKVACPTPTATYPATGTSTLNAFATATATTPVAVTSLAAGTNVICTFTVSLPSTTSPIYSGQTVSQPLTWTLTGA
jgi:hypothetical protein